MPGTSTKTKATTVRIPNALLERVDKYADENGLSRSAAIVALIEAGIDTDNSASKPLTRDDVAVLVARLDAIEESAKARHEALQANRNADIAAIVSKIESQPIVVQESRTLPDPEAWKKKGILERLLKR